MTTLTRRTFLAGAALAATRTRSRGDTRPSRTGFMQLKHGRRIAFSEYGPVDSNRVVVYFHGMPSYRIEAELLAAALESRRGVKIVTFDRPGVGDSPPSGPLSWGEFADDVAECLCAMGVRKVGACGTSGGVPFMLTLCGKHPALVTALAMAVPAFPVPRRRMSAATGEGAALARGSERTPLLARAVLNSTVRRLERNPGALVDVLGDTLSASDRSWLDRPDGLPFVAKCFSGAVADGGKRAVAEFASFVGPWPFRLHEIRTPTSLLVGDCDRNWPADQALAYFAPIPNLKVHRYRGESHFSLTWNQNLDVLDAALEA